MRFVAAAFAISCALAAPLANARQNKPNNVVGYRTPNIERLTVKYFEQDAEKKMNEKMKAK